MFMLEEIKKYHVALGNREIENGEKWRKSNSAYMIEYKIMEKAINPRHTEIKKTRCQINARFLSCDVKNI